MPHRAHVDFLEPSASAHKHERVVYPHGEPDKCWGPKGSRAAVHITHVTGNKDRSLLGQRQRPRI